MSSNGDNAVVRQAQGMVSAQASCSLDDALVLLRKTADATDETLEFVAELVVTHQVTFDPPAAR